MSEQNKNDISSMQDTEGFTALSEEEEMRIAGGADAAKPGRCKENEYLDAGTGKCVPKSYTPGPETS